MKIIPALTGPMSGKLGGMVASRNRGGQYFRRKAVPVNPDTGRQSEVRSNFATLISMWNNELTQSQRNSWIQWAANTPRIDSLGQTHILTGQNAFIGSNSLRLQAGLPLVLENTGAYNRGETVVVQSAEFVNSTPVSIELTLAFEAPASANANIIIHFGRPQNNSVEFYKNPFRFAKFDAVSQGADLTITPISNTLWPFAVPENTKLPVKTTVLYDDGRYTNGFISLTSLGVIPPP